MEIEDAFPKRPRDAHKRSVGTLAIVGGCPAFANAPAIAALGARAAGAGLIQVVAPEETRFALAVHVPEATFRCISPDVELPPADVTAFGMGLGLSDASLELVARVVEGAKGRFVLDADALNAVSRLYSGGLKPREGFESVITPHEGEAARLLGVKVEDVSLNREAAVRALASKYSATAVLKGPGTLVAAQGEGPVWKCDLGNQFMALGGMGDLLSGMIAARWAVLERAKVGGCRPAKAAKSAVWLHAKAADDLVCGAEPVEASVLNVAARAASIRTMLER